MYTSSSSLQVPYPQLFSCISFFDPHAQRSFGFCFFVLDLFASVVFLLSSVGASFVSPVERTCSNWTTCTCTGNQLYSGLGSFQCAW